MIKSEREYQVTLRAIEAFADAKREPETAGHDDRGGKAALASARAQLVDLNDQVAEWDNLRAGGVAAIEVKSLDELPMALIRARIARRLTPQQLDEKLGLRKQQIQRWEDDCYGRAEFRRLADVADALGVSVTGMARLGA